MSRLFPLTQAGVGKRIFINPEYVTAIEEVFYQGEPYSKVYTSGADWWLVRSSVEEVISMLGIDSSNCIPAGQST